MYQPCGTCPFREDPVEPGAPDWLCDVMKGIMRGSMDHSCHLTDPKADLFSGKKKMRDCVGYLGMMKRQGKCISPRAIRRMADGSLDWAKVPTRGVFQSPKAFVEFHLKANGIEVPASPATSSPG